jgi:protein Mpv17
MWNWYKSMLTTRPLWTKACTSCALMSASDVGAQAMERSMNNELVATRGTNINLQAGCPTNVDAPLDDSKKNKKVLEYDWNRTMQLGITGFTFSGPISHVWYGVLERLVTTRHYYGGLVLRMILDALLFSPVAVAGYFSWRGVLEGKSLTEIKEKLTMKWQQAVVASWSFWPAANVM